MKIFLSLTLFLMLSACENLGDGKIDYVPRTQAGQAFKVQYEANPERYQALLKQGRRVVQLACVANGLGAACGIPVADAVQFLINAKQRLDNSAGALSAQEAELKHAIRELGFNDLKAATEVAAGEDL